MAPEDVPQLQDDPGFAEEAESPDSGYYEVAAYCIESQESPREALRCRLAGSSLRGAAQSLPRADGPPGASPQITALAFDAMEDVLWAGTEDGGVATLTCPSLHPYAHWNAHGEPICGEKSEGICEAI